MAAAADLEKAWVEIVKHNFETKESEVVSTVRGRSVAEQRVESYSERRTPEERAAGIDFYYQAGERPSGYKRSKSHGSRQNPRR